MLRIAHRLLLLLIAFALVGGMTVQLARSAQQIAPVAVAGMPCDVTMPGMGGGHGKPMMPCKGVTPDCMKQMGCVADIAVPTRLVCIEQAIRSADVDYWSGGSGLTGFVSSLEPLPPRTI